MSLTLSGQDVVRLTAALRSIVSPWQYAGRDEWLYGVCRTVREAMGVDVAAVVFRQADASVTAADGTLSSESLQKYAAEWQGKIVGEARRRARGLRYWVREDVWPKEEVTRSAYYNEYCVPAGFRDSAGMSIGGKDGEQAVLYIAARQNGQFVPGGREAQLLALLQPALESGARALALLDAPERLLQAVDAPAAIFNLHGRLMHASKAFVRRMSRSRDEGALWQQAGRMAIDAGAFHFGTRRQRGALAPPHLRFRPSDGALTLCATLWEPAGVFNTPVCLITIEPVKPSLTAAHVAGRWSLTSREAEVALHLSNGVRNREIARSLGISEHTARRHTERILQKLGVHSRGEVARVIRGEPRGGIEHEAVDHTIEPT